MYVCTPAQTSQTEICRDIHMWNNNRSNCENDAKKESNINNRRESLLTNSQKNTSPPTKIEVNTLFFHSENILD